jgi:hypothetical protein
MLRQSNEPDIPALRDADSGRSKPVYSGAHDAGRHLAHRRREAAAQPDAPPPEPSGVDLEIHDRLDRPEIDAKVAAAELADYRQRMAAQLLEGVDPLTAANRASGQEQEAPQPVEPQPEAEQAPQPSERTHYTREEVETAAVAQLQDYQDRIGAILLSIRGVGVPPELMAATQSPQAWAALQSTDPHKAAQIIDYVNRRASMAQELEGQLAQVRQQQQIQSAQFKRWAEIEDAKFEKHAGKVDHALQVEALATLRDVGVSDEEVAAAWNGGALISFRDHRAQRIIADAARWRAASAKAKAATARASPPPQRPGVRMDRVSASAADLQAMSRQLDQAGSAQQALKIAGRLVAERRRAQG